MAIAARSRDIHLTAVVAAIALCGAGVPAQAPSPAPYGITTLVSLGGPASAAYDIAESGQVVVGRAQTASGAYHAFTQGYFGERNLGTLGGAESTAFAVYGGVVVGQAQIASGQQRAFAANLTTNEVTNLGTLGGTWSGAYDTRYQLIVGASKTTGDAVVGGNRVRHVAGHGSVMCNRSNTVCSDRQLDLSSQAIRLHERQPTRDHGRRQLARVPVRESQHGHELRGTAQGVNHRRADRGIPSGATDEAVGAIWLLA
jgi:probable HAF family extracellular repeat protein